ncbi:MAG: CDP-glycerol glycerophosphotransferase family protein [Treponema sp.]|nr:CDP-glycerol glycerophosphotransferase family protein [Treponema sp.]
MICNFLYIDPGTGSMLFSLFIGIATAAVFGIRTLIVKLKFLFYRGKTDEAAQKDIIPYVIFSDHKRYWNVFGPVCDEFEKRSIPLTYYTASQDDPVFSKDYKFVKAEYLGSGNKPFAKLNFLKADKVIATTPGLDVYQWKRSKDVNKYIHIPHSAGDLASYRMFGLDHYDAVLTTGENQINFIRKIESLRPAIAKKELVAVGCTYLDENQKRLALLPARAPHTAPVVLIAPSWGKSAILSKFGDKLLDELSKTDFKIIVRPHPQSLTAEKELLDSLMKKFKGKNISWNFDNDNFDVLNESDIMITDFSDIILDYTFIFNKPVIYADTNFDTLPYDADWLGEPMWSLKILPQIGVKLEEKDFPSIASVIKDTINNKGLEENRNKVKEEAWCQRGSSVKNIVDYLTAKKD